MHHWKRPFRKHLSLAPKAPWVKPVVLVVLGLIALVSALTFSGGGKTEHVAEAVKDSDSLPMMHSTGINTLISDSGVMRYRMVAEEWDIYTSPSRPATWKFMKGLFMERFDEHFHIDLFLQSDTAYLHEQRTWELRGRVVIRNIKNEVFHTEELFWDMTSHEIWSHQHMRITTPERELEGTEFRSNEQMTRYSVSNSVGAFPVEDTQATQAPDSTQATPDSTQDTPKEAPRKPTMQDHNRDRKGTEGMRFPPAPGKR